MNKQDSGNWLMRARLFKYKEDITPFAKLGREALFHKLFKPYEVIEQEGNCLLNTGIDEIWDLVTGAQVQTNREFSEANAQIGVGDDATAADPTDTDLKGAEDAGVHKCYKGMEAGFPTSATQKATFKASFGAADANFAWNEWVVKSVSGTPTNICLNRKVESLGTKSTGTWTLEIDITIS